MVGNFVLVLEQESIPWVVKQLVSEVKAVVLVADQRTTVVAKPIAMVGKPIAMVGQKHLAYNQHHTAVDNKAGLTYL